MADRLPGPLHRQGLFHVGADRYARWVALGIAATGLGYLFVLVGGLILADKSVPSAVGESLVVVLAALAATLVRRRSGLAAAIILLAVWTELHWSLLFDGDMETSALLVFPAMVVGSGFLVGGRAAVLFAALTTVSAPAAAWLGRTFVGSPGTEAAGDVYKSLVLAPVLFATASLVLFGLKALGDALMAAEANERRVRSVVDNAPDGIVALDADGRVVTANPAAERILEIGLAARGRLLTSVLGAATGSESGDALAALLRASQHAPVELDIVSRSGRALALEATSERTTDPAGRVTIQIVFRDVTARRQAEERATQFGRLLAESLHEVYVFEPDTLRIVLVSLGARENLRYGSGDLEGVAVTDINPALTRGYVESIAASLVGGREGVISTRGVHRRQDGSVYPVEMQIQRARLDGREVLVAFVSDVSARVLAEEEQRRLHTQLEHAQRMEAVGRLAGGVAHDFNNLLTVVGGCAEVLRDEAEGELKELAEEIIKAQVRGAGLTRQLLAFARREVTQPEVLTLGPLLGDVRPLLARLVGEQIRLELDENSRLAVYADRGQIEQILLNLVSNSRDAMPLGGSIRVTTTEPGSYPGELSRFVGLHVSDEGLGMDATTVDRAFEPFFTTKERGRGTGLGLSTVHGIVTQSGGQLRLSSEPGKGTTVSIFWPLPPRDAPVRAHHDADPDAPTAPTGRVLVVEDDDSARELVRLILTRAGHFVTVVPDAATGLQRLEASPHAFDLVLSDVVMPGMSGIELAAELRGLYPTLPVLLMSGYVDGEIDAGTELGATDLILKPFGAEELRRRVGVALRRAPAGA